MIETLVPLSEVENMVEEELNSCVEDLYNFVENEVNKRVSRKIHNKRYKLILARQRKRAKLRQLFTGISAMFGCVALPVILGTIFGVPELVTVELVSFPLGIYFLWESL